MRRLFETYDFLLLPTAPTIYTREAVRADPLRLNATLGYYTNFVNLLDLAAIAVYAPVAFTPGRTGRLFLEFALTLAGAVVVSGLVALTLTPMMCSKLLKHSERRNIFARVIEGALNGLERGYKAALRGALVARWLVLLMALGVGAAGGYVFLQLKSELAPTEDRGTFIVSGSAPEGASFNFTKHIVIVANVLFYFLCV